MNIPNTLLRFVLFLFLDLEMKNELIFTMIQLIFIMACCVEIVLAVDSFVGFCLLFIMFKTFICNPYNYEQINTHLFFIMFSL